MTGQTDMGKERLVDALNRVDMRVDLALAAVRRFEAAVAAAGK